MQQHEQPQPQLPPQNKTNNKESNNNPTTYTSKQTTAAPPQKKKKKKKINNKKNRKKRRSRNLTRDLHTYSPTHTTFSSCYFRYHPNHLLSWPVVSRQEQEQSHIMSYPKWACVCPATCSSRPCSRGPWRAGGSRWRCSSCAACSPAPRPLPRTWARASATTCWAWSAPQCGSWCPRHTSLPASLLHIREEIVQAQAWWARSGCLGYFTAIVSCTVRKKT